MSDIEKVQLSIIIDQINVVYHFFQLQMATHHKQSRSQASNPHNNFIPASSQLDESNLFFIHQPRKLVPTNHNIARPPSAPKLQNPDQNTYFRRAKICRSRSIKSKTDHSKCLPSSKSKEKLRYRYETETPAKAQSLHKSKSAKSFVIRKKTIPYHPLRIESSANCEAELQSMQKCVMQQVKQNSKEIEQRFQKEELTLKSIRLQSKWKEQAEKWKKAHYCGNNTHNTTVPHHQLKKHPIAFLQTKKSIHFDHDSAHLHPTKQMKSFKKNKEENKQNIHVFIQNCDRFQMESISNEQYNNCLRKQQKHKSNKQFDRKEKVHSACRTIRMPWAQPNTNPNTCEKLKKVRGHSKKVASFPQEPAQSKLMFGGISMIACPNDENSSANCGMSTQSLKELCKQLQLQ